MGFDADFAAMQKELNGAVHCKKIYDALMVFLTESSLDASKIDKDWLRDQIVHYSQRIGTCISEMLAIAAQLDLAFTAAVNAAAQDDEPEVNDTATQPPGLSGQSDNGE